MATITLAPPQTATLSRMGGSFARRATGPFCRSYAEYVRPAPFLLLALFAACGGEAAPPAPPDLSGGAALRAAPPAPPPAKGTIESLCPTDAIALFGMRSADALKPFADLRGVPADPLPRLAELLGFDPATVDRAQPLVLAASGTGPTLTLLASVSGAYQGFATLPGGARGGCPLAAARPDADLFARVDVKQVRDLYRPMIEGLLGMVQGKAGGAGDAIAVVRHLLDVGEGFEATVRRDGQEVVVDAHLETRQEIDPGVKDLAALVAALPRDFRHVAGGSAAAARLLKGLWGDTAAIGEVAAQATGGWVVGVDGPRLCLVARADGIPADSLKAPQGFTLTVDAGIARLGRDAEPDGTTPRALAPVAGTLAAFLRTGDAVATLRADGRTWRLGARGDPAALKAAYGK